MNHRTVAQYIMNKTINPGDVCVDMTLGNGNDLLFMAEIANEGKLYGFDIQELAIERSREKLEGFDHIALICESHEFFDQYVKEQINFAIFNLGYLPGGDKKITTHWNSVEKALIKLMRQLSVGGNILITTYPGHREGKIEDEALRVLLQELDQQQWDVLFFDFMNRINAPPNLYWIRKLTEE